MVVWNELSAVNADFPKPLPVAFSTSGVGMFFRFWAVLFIGSLVSLNLQRAAAQDVADQSPVTLDAGVASAWAKLVLKGIDQEYPNKPSVVLSGPDSVVAPRAMFPAFYGCFDWHSSVHGHWVLVRLLRMHPDLPEAAEIRAGLNEHFSAVNLQGEADFFSRDEHKSFERMYGWAWFLRLVIELEQSDDPDFKKWRVNMRPLEDVLAGRIMAYLPLLEFPVRTGEHPDTGFALGQILDYARQRNLDELEKLAVERACRYYLADESYPVNYEPSGQDFFSSCWNEADLMRRVLGPEEYRQWFRKFLPHLDRQLVDGTIRPVPVSDVTDGKLVHLAGLNLHRAWCLRSVGLSLPEGDPLRQALLASAGEHLAAGLKYVNSGHYEGDHWLATFALYASTMPGR